MLRNGVVFTDGGAVAQITDELQRMFKDHGANEVYACIATRAFSTLEMAITVCFLTSNGLFSRKPSSCRLSGNRFVERV
jgi:hypothetical protein